MKVVGFKALIETGVKSRDLQVLALFLYHPCPPTGSLTVLLSEAKKKMNYENKF